jgi:hypothetical protein
VGRLLLRLGNVMQEGTTLHQRPTRQLTISCVLDDEHQKDAWTLRRSVNHWVMVRLGRLLMLFVHRQTFN